MGDSVRDLVQGTVLQLFLHSEKKSTKNDRAAGAPNALPETLYLAQLIYSVWHAHFWDFTQRRIGVCYRSFEATYRLSRNVCNKLPFYVA